MSGIITTDSNNILYVCDLGKNVEYSEALRLQNNLVRCIFSGFQDTLLVLEHSPTITFGEQIRPGDENKYIKVSKNYLRKNRINYYFVNRGGYDTYHGPGQLVLYPILNFTNLNKKLSCMGDHEHYMHKLEDVVIQTLADFNIESYRNYGVWHKSGNIVGKVASIGTKLIYDEFGNTGKYATIHGLSLDVIKKDIDRNKLITNCGLNARCITISEILGHDVSTDEIKSNLIRNFYEIFRYDQIEDIEISYLEKIFLERFMVTA